MSSAETFAKNLETHVCHAVGVDPLRVRIAELEAASKQTAKDEAWAHRRDVLLSPDGNGWCASIGVGSRGWTATGPTIAAAIRFLRSKVKGGGQ